MSVIHLFPLSFTVPLQGGQVTASLIINCDNSSIITDSSEGHCKGKEAALQFTSTLVLFLLVLWLGRQQDLGVLKETNLVVLKLSYCENNLILDFRHTCEQIPSYLISLASMWEASLNGSPKLEWQAFLANPSMVPSYQPSSVCYF